VGGHHSDAVVSDNARQMRIYSGTEGQTGEKGNKVRMVCNMDRTSKVKTLMAYMQNRLTNSQRYSVVGLVWVRVTAYCYH